MKLTVISTRKEILTLQQHFEAAVVLDILRATTTITTALSHGCQGVMPVTEVEEARRIASQHDQVLLGGERGAVKLPGFHLGNSPLEYRQQAVKGKRVVLTTTNGTGTIKLAAEKAPVVLIGSLLNARAVATKLTGFNSVLLACAGTQGSFSLDDTVAAGYIIKELLAIKGGNNYSGQRLAAKRNGTDQWYAAEVPVDNALTDVVLNDVAVAAYRCALYYGDNTLAALYDSLHGQKLAQLGMDDDLTYCAQLNITDVVPCYKDDVIST
ncbi:2-phosphosulfolactate phosphatase [Peptococcaceae bacterium 1198_IL3148]